MSILAGAPAQAVPRDVGKQSNPHPVQRDVHLGLGVPVACALHARTRIKAVAVKATRKARTASDV
eukprot:360774-Chlamydomonas_euryale.AAC.11